MSARRRRYSDEFEYRAVDRVWFCRTRADVGYVLRADPVYPMEAAVREDGLYAAVLYDDLMLVGERQTGTYDPLMQERAAAEHMRVEVDRVGRPFAFVRTVTLAAGDVFPKRKRPAVYLRVLAGPQRVMR